MRKKNAVHRFFTTQRLPPKLSQVSNAHSPLSHWLVDRIPSIIMIPWNFMSHLQKLSHTIWLFNIAMENPQKWRVLVGKSSVSMGHGWAIASMANWYMSG